MDNHGVIEIEDYQLETEEEEEEEEEESEELIRVSKQKIVSQENYYDNFNDVIDAEEFDGLSCPICYKAWTNADEHRISCLPCGHIFGLSCIEKWFQQAPNSMKCPQCKQICTLKDIRLLYAARLCVVDAKLKEQVRSLQAKCASLEHKNADCCKKEVEAQQNEAALNLQVQKLTEKTKYLEKLLEDRSRGSTGSFTGSLGYQKSAINGSGSEYYSGIYTLKGEFQVDGGRYFDIDASGQLMIVARRLNGMGGTNLLTKISLVAPNEREDIQLPANSKAVRALCVKPCSRLALFASLGKKLSVVSFESNNTVLAYDLPLVMEGVRNLCQIKIHADLLPLSTQLQVVRSCGRRAPAWSCSWDIDSSHHVYTGLQNGMVLAFDMRQTRTPLESRDGLSNNPVHTVISVASDSSLPSGTRTLLSASQIGMCEWNIDCSEERPYLIPESENQGVCISLAYSGSNDIVASFRPKIEMSGDIFVSQSLPSPSMSCGVQGCHIFYRRTGPRAYQNTGSLVAQLDSIRLPKSSIINKQNQCPVFVSANEVTSNLILRDIFSLNVTQRLDIPKKPIWDVRCTQIWNSCVLGCLSGDVVQLFMSP